MKMSLIKNFVWVVMLALLISCEKEEDHAGVLNAPNVYLGNRGVVVEWQPADIANFKYYEVLRSTNGTDFDVIPSFSTYDSTLSLINHTTFTDIAYPLVGKVYYKIAAYGDERIESPQAGLTVPKPIKLDFFPLEAHMMADKERILLFNNEFGGPKLSLLDYKNGTILKQYTLPSEHTGFSYGFGKFQSNYEFYFYGNSEPKMEVYDALTFDYKTSFTYDQPWSVVTSDFSKFIYYTNNKNIITVDRTTLASKTYTSSMDFIFERIYRMEGANKLFGITYPVGIANIELTDQGTVTGVLHFKMPGVNYIGFIEGTNYIYTNGLDGFNVILTDNWLKSSLLDENGQSLNPSLLHAKNGVLYAYSGRWIYCYSLDKLKLKEYFPTRVEPNLLLSDDNELILISKTTNGEAIIDKMELSK